MNALLEHVPVEGRTAVVNHYLPHAVSTWTLPGGISASDEDDQDRLLRFLDKKPEIEQAIVAQMQARTRYLNSLADAASRVPVQAAGSVSTQEQLPAMAAQIAMPSRMPVPNYTMHIRPALKAYQARYRTELKTQINRTSDDKESLLQQLIEYLERAHPELGNNPLAHLIDTPHLRGFLNEQAARPGKRVNAKGEQATAAPLTLIGKLGALNHFFEFLRGVEKVVLTNPAAGLADAREAWQAQASAEDFHYHPFQKQHIVAIFQPDRYLALTRDPDHFWCPLLGMHLGCRLGEIVNRRVSDIGHIHEIDVWYIDVPPEGAKNANSVRRLPITQPLIDLGFLQYVEHVRRLGAEYLFPHRDWTTPTAERDRSKTQSGRFATNMDRIDIRSPHLVFHSFRHTVVTVLHDSGVPLAHAMQICGHEAQAHAIKKGTLTEEQARSVHHSTYTHADMARLGTEFPILPLKAALEKAIILPIDYDRLRIGADIVREHTRKIGDKFRTGWPAQRSNYTTDMLARLGSAPEPDSSSAQQKFIG